MAKPKALNVNNQTPLQSGPAGQAKLPTPPVTPELRTTTPVAVPGENVPETKQKGKFSVLNITGTSQISNGGSASGHKVPATKSANLPALPAKIQQNTKGKAIGRATGKANPASLVDTTSGPTSSLNPAKNNASTHAKGKRNTNVKKAVPAPNPTAPIAVPKAFITSFPNSKPSTLFPKITGNIDLIESRYRVDNRKPNRDRAFNVLKDEVSRRIDFVGSVKLHGQHADIVIDSKNTIRLQSRNMPALNEKQDIVGFAQTMFFLEKNLLHLKDRIQGRWIYLNQNETLSDNHPLIIAGEWVGPGVQKNVALAELPRKYFVITSISINNCWVDDKCYADIEDEEAGIVHVGRGGFFTEHLDVTDLETSQERMLAVASEVEKTCPFGKSFGIIGKGEGVVWKAVQPLGRDPRMWLKTKGPGFAVTRTSDLPKLNTKVPDVAVINTADLPTPNTKTAPMSEDLIERTRQFAYATATHPRMEQGWNVLSLERNEPMDKTTKTKFMRWVSEDIILEEKPRIKALKVDEVYLIKCIRWMAEIWYDDQVECERLHAMEMKKVEGAAIGSLGGGVHMGPENKGTEVKAEGVGAGWW